MIKVTRERLLNVSKVTVTVLCFYFLTCAVLFSVSVRGTGSHYVYPLDDTYIHMAMARNIAENGVYGVTRGEYSSSSSSPLWCVIIALGFKLLGRPVELLPLLMSFASGVLLLLVSGFLLKRAECPVAIRFAILIAILWCTPMPILAFSGMEHLLHTVLTILIVFSASSILAYDSQDSLVSALPFACALISVAVVIRFETLFIVFIFASFLLIQRQWFPALAVVASGGLPLVITGAFAVAHGWFWFPGSVLIKSAQPPVRGLGALIARCGGRSLDQLYASPHLLVLFVAVVFRLYLRRRFSWRDFQVADWMLVFCGLATVCHLQFAGVGWVFRYEAYLVCLSLFALAFSFAHKDAAGGPLFSNCTPLVVRATALVLFMIAAYPVVMRGKEALMMVTRASRNIYEQQYQMAHFLKQFYGSATVAANDVGAINFYSNIICVDLAGLSNLTVAHAILNRRYSTKTIDEEATRRTTRVAVLYDNWFDGDKYPKIPRSWTRVGRWTVTNNFILGGATVSFYAVQRSECAPLFSHLDAYRSELPSDVTVEIVTCPKEPSLTTGNDYGSR